MNPVLDIERFELLTFDCYGTLIDWEGGILGALRPVLHRHGVEAEDEEILEWYGEIEARRERGDYVRYEVLLGLVVEELSRRLGFEASESERGCIAASIRDWAPFPDTISALRALKQRFRLAVISNIDDGLFEATARRLEVAFDWVITAEQAGAYKPAAETFEYAFRRFGIPRQRILHVAQSLYHDIAPARALGVSTVWVNRRGGLRGPAATPATEARPDVEVPDLRALVESMGL